MDDDAGVPTIERHREQWGRSRHGQLVFVRLAHRDHLRRAGRLLHLIEVAWVEDQDGRLGALQRAGELTWLGPCVQRGHGHPELLACEHGLDLLPSVAQQRGHRVLGRDPPPREDVRHLVGAPVELAPGEGAGPIVQRRLPRFGLPIDLRHDAERGTAPQDPGDDSTGGHGPSTA